jgi:hypothetical protein
MPFTNKTLDQLDIDDEASFRHVGLYADLKRVLQRSSYTFRVLPEAMAGRWDRALALNLTFWDSDAGGDVLALSQIPADVVAHVAWHHLAARHLRAAPGAKLTADALFLGESIASAFDLYLVGRLLGHAPESSFLETQVPAMQEAAMEAGLTEGDFERLIVEISHEPEKAFEDLRALLYDITRALFRAASAEAALEVFARYDAHRFGALLHRHELSNWVLYARAYAEEGEDPRAAEIDGALREARDAVEWLTRRWVDPSPR